MPTSPSKDVAPKTRPVSVVQIVDFIRISVPIVAVREVPTLPLRPRLSNCSINPKVCILNGVYGTAYKEQ